MASKTKQPQKNRRNERERKRVHQVNQGFNILRDRVPKPNGCKQKLSKVETLREAVRYIQQLRSMLGEGNQAAMMSPNCSAAQQFYQMGSPFYPTPYSRAQEVSPCASNYYGSSASDSSSYDEQSTFANFSR